MKAGSAVSVCVLNMLGARKSEKQPFEQFTKTKCSQGRKEGTREMSSYLATYAVRTPELFTSYIASIFKRYSFWLEDCSLAAVCCSNCSAVMLMRAYSGQVANRPGVQKALHIRLPNDISRLHGNRHNDVRKCGFLGCNRTEEEGWSATMWWCW